jgi:hypothetical protein
MVPFPAAPTPPAEPPVTLPPPGGDEPVFEACNRYVTSEGGPLLVYAVHEYPGKTLLELSSVRAIGRLVEGPEGFKSVMPMRVYVRDGAVAVFCGTLYSASDTPYPPRGEPRISGVTFVPGWK